MKVWDTNIFDLTRCGIAMLSVATTAILLLLGREIPDKWWVALAMVMGFYFALEVPNRFRNGDGSSKK